MRFKALSITILSLLSVSAQAKYMPENDLWLLDDISRASNISEADFNRIIDSVVDVYTPMVELHGGKLEVNREWEDPTVNASAEQIGDSWVLNMYGGLARRDEVTQDGFAMVMCHELGHHLGGFPFYTSDPWAASEGQADYFATYVCARHIWAGQAEENAKARESVDPTAKAGCDKVYSDTKDQDLCYRTANAGLSLGTLLAVLGESGAPRFDTPDTSKVDTSVEGHPQAQCRLDTYFQGALCLAKFDEKIIPGKTAVDGNNSPAAEKEAASNSCMNASHFQTGLRPACWFKERD